MLNKTISPAARFCLLGFLFLSGSNGLMMEIVFRRQLLMSLGVNPLFGGHCFDSIYGRAWPMKLFIWTYSG
jgi:hypothetical protein